MCSASRNVYFILFIFLSGIAAAQVPIYDLPLTVSDEAEGSTVLRFGLAPTATDGIDTSLGEAVLPPLPPAGVFDARFELPVNNDASLKDYRQGEQGIAVIKRYRLRYQPGSGSQIKISWSLGSTISARLNDIITGMIIDVPMSGQGSYIVTNPSAINTLFLTVNYPDAIVPPPPPVLSQPQNGAIQQNLPVNLVWNQVPNALRYQVQVSLTSSFENLVTNDSMVSSGQFQAAGLAFSTTYYWRVRAVSSNGHGPYSSVWNFTTISQLPAPILLSPNNGAGGQSLQPGLSWSQVQGAVSYNVQVSLNQYFTDPLLDTSSITTNSLTLSGLNYGTTYYWRARAKGGSGYGLWSDTWRFGTVPAPLGLLYNIPITVSDNTGSNLELKLGIAPDASDGIDLQYGEAVLPPMPPAGVFDARFNLPWNFGSSLKDYRAGYQNTILSCSHELQFQPGNGNSITINWDMPANVDGLLQDVVTGNLIHVAMTGIGSYTIQNPSAFPRVKITINYPGIPPAPELVTPQASGTMNPVFTMLWNRAQSAAFYHVQLYSSSQTIPIVNDSTITDNRLLVTGLEYNTGHSVRIRAGNSYGFGPWTQFTYFQTITQPQGLAYSIPLSVTDNSTGYSLMHFGIGATASDGIDSAYGEAPRPPVPGSGAFDARFVLPSGEGTYKDIRPGAINTYLERIYTVKFQAGSAVTLHWDMPQGVNGIMRDVVSGLITIPMSGSGSYTVENPALINQLRMTIWYPGPPDQVLLAAPANGSTVPAALSLIWHRSTPAAVYHLQLSTDPQFTSVLLSDTNITDTIKQLSGLNYSTSYYWRVQALNSYGSSGWSQAWQFRTTAPPAGIVYDLPLSISDMAGGDRLIFYGLAYNATDGIDTMYGEAPLPPVPPAGVFDARFNLPSGSESSYRDYRQFAPSTSNAKVYKFQYQPGAGTAIKISWNMPDTISGRLNDLINGMIVDVPMTGTGSYTVASPAAINQLKITVSYPGTLLPPSAPTLLVPTDGSINQPLSLSLGWNLLPAAASYQVQVAKDQYFTNLVVNDSGLTGVTADITNLQPAAVYYWRVRAANNAGIGAWSSVWSFSTIPLPPDPPLPVMPYNGAVNQALQLQLQWTIVPGASSYAAEVAVDSTFSTIFMRDSNITAPDLDISGLQPLKTYYWHVRSRNAAGYSAWSLKSRFTTIQVAPEAPTLISPLNGALNLTLPVSLNWYAMTTANVYQAVVSNDPQFLNIAYNDSTLTSSSCTLSQINAGLTYFWKVRAGNSAGWGPWSAVRSFSIKAGLIYNIPLTFSDSVQSVSCYFGLAPDATYCIDPQYGELALPPTPPSGIEASFYLDCDGGTYTTRDYRQGTDTTQGPTIYKLVFSPFFGPRITILWHLPQGIYGKLNDIITGTIINQPISGIGQLTVPTWCTKLTMTIYWLAPGAPLPPQLVSPLNNSILAGPVSFKWRASSSAYRYQLQIAQDSSFTSLIYNDTTIADTAKTLNTLVHGQAYYWRVRGIGITGLGSWSTIWKCTPLLYPPAGAILQLPLNGAANLPLNPTCVWRSVPFAEQYYIQAARDIQFTSIVFSEGGFTDTSRAVTGLDYYTNYYWRVRSHNFMGYSPWSDPRWFTTAPAIPAAVILAQPDSGLTGISIFPVLKWFNRGIINNYHLQAARDSVFTSMVLDDSMLVDTMKQMSGLQYHTWYYWRVSARNEAGQGEFSTVWKFRTTADRPGTPLLIAPVNQALRQQLRPVCTWNSALYAQSYSLELSFDSTFTSLARYYTSLTDTTLQVDSLQYGNWYYWRVRASNESGSGSNSSIWKFRTIAKPVAAPSGLSGQCSGNTVCLSWHDNADNESGYIVFRRPGTDTNSAAQFLPIDTIEANAQAFCDTSASNSRYTYAVQAFTADTVSAFSNFFTAVLTAFNDQGNYPAHYALYQNYPNPFNPVTVIDFDLQYAGFTTLKIYDFLGRETAVLINKEMNAGRHSVKFDAAKLNSGVYFYSLRNGKFNDTKKLILLK